MTRSVAVDTQHIERIKRELQEVGISWLGLQRFTSRYLPQVVHKNEHIHGAIFGRRKESEGIFGFVEALLVATDKRIIFVDHRPGYTTMDEVSYDMVSGVNVSTAGFYASVTLFTKIANYHLSYSRIQAAQQFADYIEKRVIDTDDPSLSGASDKPLASIPQDTLNFLQTHELGVLSSIDRTGMVTGAAIYYVMRDSFLYFITKTSTEKAANILANQHVAFTVVDEPKQQVAKVQGIVQAEANERIKKEVSDAIIRARHYENGTHLPPVMYLDGNNFVTFCLTPTRIVYDDYRSP